MQQMTGSNLSQYNIMAMGITPYINSSHYHAAALCGDPEAGGDCRRKARKARRRLRRSPVM